MFKLHTKKSTLNMKKFASLKKVHTKIIMVNQIIKEILSWMIWDLSVIQQKYALAWPGLYRLIFQKLYDTSLTSPRWYIDETVNFRNFPKLFTNKCAAFLGILAPYFQAGKTKQSSRAHEACCNGCQLM